MYLSFECMLHTKASFTALTVRNMLIVRFQKISIPPRTCKVIGNYEGVGVKGPGILKERGVGVHTELVFQRISYLHLLEI